MLSAARPRRSAPSWTPGAKRVVTAPAASRELVMVVSWSRAVGRRERPSSSGILRLMPAKPPDRVSGARRSRKSSAAAQGWAASMAAAAMPAAA
jgi:hypothetical protein